MSLYRALNIDQENETRKHKMGEKEISLIDSALKSAIDKRNKERGSIKLSDLDELFSDDEGQKSDQTVV